MAPPPDARRISGQRRLASGQALVGGAELSVGAWTFLMCIFVGGWLAAWFVRKQWI